MKFTSVLLALATIAVLAVSSVQASPIPQSNPEVLQGVTTADTTDATDPVVASTPQLSPNQLCANAAKAILEECVANNPGPVAPVALTPGAPVVVANDCQADFGKAVNVCNTLYPTSSATK